MKKNDLKALGFLKDWSSWLAAIETGVIAAIGAMIKDINPPDYIPLQAKICAAGAALSSLLSLIGAGYVLLGLPGIAQRLPPEREEDDVFSMKTGGGTGKPLVFWVRWELDWAGISILLFALFVIFLLWR